MKEKVKGCGNEGKKERVYRGEKRMIGCRKMCVVSVFVAFKVYEREDRRRSIKKGVSRMRVGACGVGGGSVMMTKIVSETTRKCEV